LFVYGNMPPGKTCHYCQYTFTLSVKAPLTMKQVVLPIAAMLLLFAACRQEPVTVKFRGKAMGTYYEATYLSENGYVNYQPQIDSVLAVFNESLSTYSPTSIVSKVNQANAGDTIPVDDMFATVFTKSVEVNQKSGGAFDPSVMPLVNAWGFGYQKNPPPVDSAMVDSLLKLVDLASFTLLKNPWRMVKGKQNTQLDFNAIAQGYGVDVVCEFLEKQNIHNYLVDIGGELRARGQNAKFEPWTVGIDKPIDTLKEREVQEIVRLRDMSISTSGNYRKFYIKDGVKYAHTIDPKTGRPKLSNLLSVSVFNPQCITADAYATAFMVMGYEKARNFAEAEPALNALFIYSDEQGNLKTYYTPGVEVVTNKP